MLNEIACDSQDSTFHRVMETIFVAAEKSADCVALPSGFLPRVTEFFDDSVFAAAIDFPYGLSGTQVRLHEILLSIRQGASLIDLVLNSSFIAEQNWRKIKEDIKACLAVCNQNGIELRCIIEYRLFEPKTVLYLCDFLFDLGIQQIVNATGSIVDDLNDNALISYQIQKKTEMSVISCGAILNKQHYEMFKNLDIHAVRFTSPKIAEDVLSYGV